MVHAVLTPAKFIILNTKFLVFDAQFLDFNAKFIISAPELIARATLYAGVGCLTLIKPSFIDNESKSEGT